MARWLFNSGGTPIAFINGNNVFSKNGQFIGRLNGNEVWHGQYQGEIVEDDRLLYKTTQGSVVRATPGRPGTPGIPGRPGSRGAIGVPGGYRDISMDG